jgi:hypothetical protein
MKRQNKQKSMRRVVSKRLVSRWAETCGFPKTSIDNMFVGRLKLVLKPNKRQKMLKRNVFVKRNR